MALTIAKLDPNPDHVAGNKKVRYRTVTFDSSYPTDGEAIAASDFGLKKIEVLEVCGLAMKTDESDAVAVSHDPTAGTLVAFQSTTGAPAKLVEVANTTDLSAYSVIVKAIGW